MGGETRLRLAGVMGEGTGLIEWDGAGVGIGSVELGGDGTREDVGGWHGRRWCRRRGWRRRDKFKVV